MTKAAESKVSEAVGFAGAGHKDFGRDIEHAMAKATLKALSDGVTDPDEQRALAQAAREDIVTKYRADQAKAAKDAQAKIEADAKRAEDAAKKSKG